MLMIHSSILFFFKCGVRSKLSLVAVKALVWNWSVNQYVHELVDVEVKGFLLISNFYKTAKC